MIHNLTGSRDRTFRLARWCLPVLMVLVAVPAFAAPTVDGNVEGWAEGYTHGWNVVFSHDGSAQTLLEGIHTEARARKDIANRWLSGIGQLPPTSIHVWHTLPDH